MKEAPESFSVRDEKSPEAGTASEERRCLNCNAVVSGKYCSECGQKFGPRRQTVSELAFTFLATFSGYESKFFKTCRYLLLKPGFLANEYNAGRRERYFHPVRMYAFVSVIYFFLYVTIPGANDSKSILTISKDGIDITSAPLDSVDLKGPFDTRQHYDSVQAALPESDRDGWFKRKMQYKLFDLKEKFEGNPNEFASHVVDDFTSHTSIVFFFLLPVFALILWLLYYKKDFYYSEHLVFSVYYYNFFFLAGSIVFLIDTVPWMGWLATLLKIAIFFYLLWALKRTYSEGWPKTILKFVTFMVVFGICILVGLLVNLFITLMFI